MAAQHIAARIRGTSSSAQYGGHGICYLEFGDDEVGMVDVTFFGDQRSGELIGPSTELAAEKAQFGSSRACAGSDANGARSRRTSGDPGVKVAVSDRVWPR